MFGAPALAACSASTPGAHRPPYCSEPLTDRRQCGMLPSSPWLGPQMQLDQLKRRTFVTLFGGAAAWPLAARAQWMARVPRIGIVDDAPMWHSFRQALRELGYVEGQSVNYEYRYSEGVPDRLATVMGELVRRPVDLITVYGTPPTEAARAATTTIPIVMVGVGDPVRVGLVASLARPGGNITGNTVLSPDLSGKRLQLLREAIPAVARVQRGAGALLVGTGAFTFTHREQIVALAARYA